MLSISSNIEIQPGKNAVLPGPPLARSVAVPTALSTSQADLDVPDSSILRKVKVYHWKTTIMYAAFTGVLINIANMTILHAVEFSIKANVDFVAIT